MSVYNNTNSRPLFDQGTPPPSPPNAQKEDDSNLPSDESFAASTYLQMDKQDAERFNQLKENYTNKEIASWVGHVRGVSPGYEGCKISMRDARLINQKAKTPIFKIDETRLIQIKLTELARETLKRICLPNQRVKICNELELFPNLIHHIINGTTVTISKENADKIEQHFDTDLFGMHQIFERARTENIDGVKKKREEDNPALLTVIEHDDESREKVKNLEPNVRGKIVKIIGTNIYKQYHSISVRNAVVINKISGSKIFSFSAQKLVKVPYSTETCTQLNELIEEKIAEEVSLGKIAKKFGLSSSNTLKAIRKRKHKEVEFKTAEKINIYFKKRLFDFEKLLSEAVTDADHFYETSIEEPEKTDSTPSPVHVSSESASDSSIDSPPALEPVESSSKLSTTEIFADSTYIKIDELAIERLDQLKKEVKRAKITSWVGSKRRYLGKRGADKISIRDARIINKNSKRTIFKIREKDLLVIKVTDSARETLETLNRTYEFKKSAELLGFHPLFFSLLKNGHTSTISIENARKIDRFFKTDVFCIHEIFNRACSENIHPVENVDDSSVGEHDTDQQQSTRKRKARVTEEEAQLSKKPRTGPVEESPADVALDETQLPVDVHAMDDFPYSLSNEDEFWQSDYFDQPSTSYSSLPPPLTPYTIDTEIDSFFS